MSHLDTINTTCNESLDLAVDQMLRDLRAQRDRVEQAIRHFESLLKPAPRFS